MRRIERSASCESRKKTERKWGAKVRKEGSGTNDDLERRDLNRRVAGKGLEGDGVVWRGKVVEPLRGRSRRKDKSCTGDGKCKTDLDGESEAGDGGGKGVLA